MSDGQDAFQTARENDEQVNEMLADTGGRIAMMQYDGAIGYHIHVATGETDPEYLWKVALLQALDEMAFETLYVDEDTPALARDQVESQLREMFPMFQAEQIAAAFEDNLSDLIDVQEERGEGGEDHA